VSSTETDRFQRRASMEMWDRWSAAPPAALTAADADDLESLAGEAAAPKICEWLPTRIEAGSRAAPRNCGKSADVDRDLGCSGGV